ncbi:hypothetical protein L0Z65_11705 [Phaeobacter sp. BS52]|uniref:Lipoprotein n=1 Tax=Phaeobacter piscinae TaxID=1580596 RepID=A0AAN1L9D2_9RHOB|nr:hypothetical protein [Phaeobacter piscinae]ATG42239.1 hypothetical protein PhaeoP13_00273 [Phaeobacter piscinae]AUR34573.1 hypothetical protein PhaeoP18_00274 [Phaeobacter piscinae]
MKRFILSSAALLALANCADTSDLRSLPPGPATVNFRGVQSSYSLDAELPAISNFCATFVDQKRAPDDLAKAGYEFNQSKYSYSYKLYHGKYNATIKAPTIDVRATSARPTSWGCDMTLLAQDETIGVKALKSFQRAMAQKGWKPVSGSSEQYTKNGRTVEIGGRFRVSTTNSDARVWIRDWN